MSASRYALQYAEKYKYSNFITESFKLSPLPGIVGGTAGSFELELSGSLLGQYIMKNKDIREDNNEYQHYLELDKGAY